MIPALLFAAQAASYDPQMTWRTIRTDHFNITFHQGIETVADEFATEVEGIYDTMSEEMQWKPRRRTEVVLVDRTDAANGYASVVPYNAIVIFVTAPQEDSTLSLYEDWSTAIMTHELTHVLHMDSNHGIVRVARAVVGRVATTNDVSPWWMVEGLATFQETRHTDGGRGRTPMVDMIKRTAVIEDAFPPLGNLDGLQPKPPAGNLRYLFGQDFIQHIADHQGDMVWTKWVHTYGSWIPFWLPTKRVFGKSLVRSYFEWRDALEVRYAHQLAPVEALGVTPTRRLSDDKASCGAPAFSPDGDWLVWSCYDLRTGSAIWRSDGQGYAAEKLVQDRGAKNFTWRSDSKAFVYAASHTVNRFNTWSDIYLYDLGSKSTSALSNGARARDPDFSPDGSRLVMVTNKAELNQLEVATIDRRREALTEATDHTQFSTPRHSPDGRSIAVSVWEDGRRDLWLYAADGTPKRRVTMDVTVDRDPAWSADGRWLYFSSDRTGIPNIFAVDMETEHLWQVTNVRTGAAKPHPSPRGDLLAFNLYSNDGWEVHAMDLDPARFIDHGVLPRPLRYDAPLADLSTPVEPKLRGDTASASLDASPKRRFRLFAGHRPFDPVQTAACGRWKSFDLTTPGVAAPIGFRADCMLQSPEERVDNFDMTDAEDAFGKEEDIDWHVPPRRYNPLPTLLPRYALPYIQTTPYAPSDTFDFIPWPYALQGTIASSGADMLRHFAWSGAVTYRTDVNYLGAGGAITINRWLPVYSFGATTGAAPTARYYVADPDEVDENGDPLLYATDSIYWEKRQRIFASVSYPYRPRTTIFARYSMTWRNELFPIPDGAYLPLIPIRGRVGELAGGWRYSWSQPTSYAISLEDARIFSLIGSVTHPLLGTAVRGDGITGSPDEFGKLTVAQVTAELREYVVNPLIPNHVLAAKLGGGYTIGANQFLGNYQLGGSIGDNAFVTAPDESRMLRGYEFATDIGDRYWLTSAEYRFPIWQVQRGVGTIPVFFRNISGAVFLDAGNAFTDIDDWQGVFDDTLVGTGVEISTRWALGWGAFVTGRLGYGVGLTPVPLTPNARHAPDDPRSFYFQLGGSF
ncbi:MAG: PD40 domain-containing protein [Alphaproteobacteria bacterium]|nr:PD40 domain-containing protein [Alphaproteobacteria bacterium]